MADISDFDDGRSGYDLNEYTQGNYDGVLDSADPSPKNMQKDEIDINSGIEHE